MALLHFVEKGARRAQHQIVGLAGQRRGEWTVESERKIRRRNGPQLVALFGKRHQTIEQVIAVGAPADHMQVEIELGRRRLGDGDRLRRRAQLP